jgi:hypothetical protein
VDGSVQFMSDNIDLETQTFLAVRDDRFSVNAD